MTEAEREEIRDLLSKCKEWCALLKRGLSLPRVIQVNLIGATLLLADELESHGVRLREVKQIEAKRES